MSYITDLHTVDIAGPGGSSIKVVGGSFRGIPFFVSSHQWGSGRRIASHEFPGRDDPFHEDLGRKSRTVTLDAHLIGEDVMAQKRALLDSCEAVGPGRLVHPYMGIRNARCSGITISETSTEKRYVGISLTFELDPDISAPPAITTDSGAVVKVRAATATAATASKVAEGKRALSIASAAKGTITSAVDATNQLLDQVEAARNTMRSAAAYVSKLGQIRANLELLLLTPSDFVTRVQELVTMAQEAVMPSGAEPSTAAEEAQLLRLQVEEALQMGASTAQVRQTGTTHARDDQERNLNALLALFRETALWDMAAKLIGCRVDSAQDSLDLQDRISDTFDAILSDADDVETYQSAQAVLASCLAYLRATSANLATIQTVTHSRTVPALVLAYELYGDASRADDLVERNGIEHPGFVAGGVPLEVLSR